MQPHSVLHSLIQTYHEYLLDGNYSATEIPRIRKLQSTHEQDATSSFELYFEVLNENSSQKNKNLRTNKANRSNTSSNTYRRRESVPQVRHEQFE